VPEVNASFEQFFHANRRQKSSLPAQWLNPESTAQSGICGPGEDFRRQRIAGSAPKNPTRQTTTFQSPPTVRALDSANPAESR
jgi:hypothetical protein